MKTVVLDTSVILKWFHGPGEVDRDAALLLRDAYLNGALDVVVPDLLVYELSNALRFKSGLDMRDTMEMVSNLWRVGLRINPTDASLSSSTVEIAYAYGLTIYDAAFVALARQLSATFITADRKLYENVTELDGIMLLSDVTR